MEPEEHLEGLRRESARFAAAARRGLGSAVAACPGWTVGDLVVHLGVIHRRVEKSVRTSSTGPVWAEPGWEVDPGRPDLVGWFEAGASQLAATLERHGPDAPCWHWFPGGTARILYRRMAQETAVHRWDAEAAHRSAEAIEPRLAADGIDEYLASMLPSIVWRNGPPQGTTAAGETFAFRCVDEPAGWVVTFDAGGPTVTADADADADPAGLVVSGPASDVLLFLWRRVPVDRLAVSGDPALLERWSTLAAAI